MCNLEEQKVWGRTGLAGFCCLHCHGKGRVAILNLMSKPDWVLMEVGRADGQERPLRRTPVICVLGRQGGPSDRLPTRVEVATGLLGRKRVLCCCRYGSTRPLTTPWERGFPSLCSFMFQRSSPVKAPARSYLLLNL